MVETKKERVSNIDLVEAVDKYPRLYIILKHLNLLAATKMHQLT